MGDGVAVSVSSAKKTDNTSESTSYSYLKENARQTVAQGPDSL